MKPRKNTVNDLTDVRDPLHPTADVPQGSKRRSRGSFPVRMLRRVSNVLRNLNRPLLPREEAEAPSSPVMASQTVSQATGQAASQVPGEASDDVQANSAAEPISAGPARPPSRSKKSGQSQGAGQVLTLFRRILGRSVAQFLASLTFYTLLPIPFPQRHEFHRIARFAPWVGLLLGLGLGIADWGLGALGMNAGLRTAIVVVSWLGLTGGLHMDGAMDSADGLAVMDPKRRLAVMSDSVTGAFGVMVAMSLLLLKFSALMALPVDPVSRTVALMAAMGWGRWGQVLAIDRYVYLRVEGKGAFHKRQLRSPDDLWPGLIALLGLSALFIWLFPYRWMLALGMVLGGFAIAFGTGAWFDRQLGGHTGDTYGAVVEWTEALLLCLLTLL